MEYFQMLILKTTKFLKRAFNFKKVFKLLIIIIHENILS